MQRFFRFMHCSIWVTSVPRALTLGVLLLVSFAQGTAWAQDSTPPAAFDLAAPTNGAWCGANCTFRWRRTTDDVGVVAYQLWIDGQIVRDNLSFTMTSYALAEAEALAEGYHTWFVRARDAAGNYRQSTSTWTVQVDATAPGSFELLAPAQGHWSTQPDLEFSWQASSDTQSTLDCYRLRIDNVVQRVRGGGTSMQCISPTTTTLVGSDIRGGPHLSYQNGVPLRCSLTS